MRPEQARRMLFEQKSRQHLFDKLTTYHDTVCPVCGDGIKKRVIEHPHREMGIDGQTVFICQRCHATKIFPFTMDEGRELGTPYTPGITGRQRGYVARIDAVTGRLKEVKPV